ncbi:MAG: biotin--[acetyl-CoA-carboxylase] ligase [Planctomycetia bacterium]|nr:biotin--[acetyl-CoA-carboxylase] ligase [Planctomycetia bacterium]
MNFDLSLMLRECRNKPVGLHVLSSRLRLPPKMVTRDLEELAGAGFAVHSTPHQGLSLADVPRDLIADEIAHRLDTRRVGKRIRTVEQTTSTNDIAHAEGVDGFAVFAEFQSAGRGRLGNRWEAPPHKAILASVLVLMPQAPHEAAVLTLAAGIATARAIKSEVHADVSIKWPNDVEIRGKKVAGILVEHRSTGARIASAEPPSPRGNKAGLSDLPRPRTRSRDEDLGEADAGASGQEPRKGKGAFVIGIGINVHQGPADFPSLLHATSCQVEATTQGPVDRTLLARELLRELDNWCSVAENPEGVGTLLHVSKGLSNIRGRQLTVREDGKVYRGKVIDIVETYGLAMRLDDGSLHVFDALRTAVVG